MPVTLRELLPGFLAFDCERQHSTLSPAACAAQYLKHKGTASACAGCHIGAEHAGEQPAQTRPRRLCCRCGRTDMRLVGGAICVSCWNRQREWLIGRNGKGQFPKLARPVFPTQVFVVGGGVVGFKRVADIGEAILAALRKHPGAIVRPLPPAFSIDFLTGSGADSKS